MNKYYYITTTLPYVNAKPHIGFAMELVRTDVLARFHKKIGQEVIFNTGTDEHGQKIYQQALAAKKSPQEYCNYYAAQFARLKEALNICYNRFIRTTDTEHINAAQEFWRRVAVNGDIYKAKYEINYCVGCELEKTDSELVDGKCPLHPNQKLEKIEEENYFFRFSKYQKSLLDFYEKNPNFLLPDFRFQEIKNFVKAGLKDFSISRLKAKMPWGIPVPDDPDHVMYVWFDALINYISTLGWPKDEENFKKFWPGIQVAGKDNLRQQTAMWQAMLMAAGLPNSKKIYIEGFITAEGQKMSKSLGNVIDPFFLVEKFGTDAVRYYLLKEIPSFEDGDYSQKRMLEIYNSDLANELGNLVLRLTTLGQKNNLVISSPKTQIETDQTIHAIDNFQFNLILEEIWQEIKKLNKKIDEFAPWSKEEKKQKIFLTQALERLNFVGQRLQPFLPETAGKIDRATSGKIEKISPLFPRL